MLADKEMFDVVEQILIKNGEIANFERENGKILGRMMITQAEIPVGIEIQGKKGKQPMAFEASYDFYDANVGVAIFPDTREAASGIWITPQVDGAESPDRSWIEFFVQKLLEGIGEDGSVGLPIYSFVTDNSDMTIVPQ